MFTSQFKTHYLAILLLSTTIIISNISYAYRKQDLTGIIINYTTSNTGFNFYQSFAGIWRLNDTLSADTLIINEQLSAHSGSIITIKKDEKLLFQKNIQHTRSDISLLAEQAYHIVKQQLYRIKIRGAIDKDPDISASGL
ncbi:CsgE family curli-type amyloid fiber assembly protein [Oceanospirillum sediminis]|uniref:Curli production assembly/transport component CsgE n=1 Tax=Oceanospirillum sediminis TaxID=2760088 RepID=A0A839IL79_9GAMM|nr:CsgE family curli-type amyloid fiber assembly protein [Oceanospirillum sediminis]MBB1486153.1 hypothetical protein [Oceanospirillum sediminis]